MQADQKLGRLVDLSLELFLLQAQSILLAAYLLLVGLVLGLDLLGVLSGADVAVLQRLVAQHDLPHVVHGGEHLAEVIRLEDQGQIVDGAVFLHGAHAGAVAVKLLLLLPLGVEDFLLLVGDHLVIQPDFLLVELELLHGVGVALVQGALLNQDADGVFLELVDLGLLFLAQALDLIPLGAQGLDLRLGDSCMGRGRQRRQQRGTEDQA